MSITQARAYLAQDAFADFLGLRLLELAPERAVLLLPFRAEHANAAGPLNGGASASLLLTAGSLAAWTGIDLDGRPKAGCVDMTIHYLAPALEEDVVAEAHVLQRGRDLFFLSVTLNTPAGKPICQGQMMYRAPDYATHAPRLLAQPLLPPAPVVLTPPEAPWILHGYVEKLGITSQHQSPGRIRMHLPCNPVHQDKRGRLHSGALASLVDVAGTAAAWSLVPRRHESRGATVGMHIQYAQPVSTAVIADAYVQQRSEELFFSTVPVITATTGQLVALGQVSYRLREPYG